MTCTCETLVVKENGQGHFCTCPECGGYDNTSYASAAIAVAAYNIKKETGELCSTNTQM